MVYDSRATLVTRLTANRAAQDKARNATRYVTGGGMGLTRDLDALQREEKWILDQIAKIDAASSGGMFNKVKFVRPS